MLQRRRAHGGPRQRLFRNRWTSSRPPCGAWGPVWESRGRCGGQEGEEGAGGRGPEVRAGGLPTATLKTHAAPPPPPTHLLGCHEEARALRLRGVLADAESEALAAGAMLLWRGAEQECAHGRAGAGAAAAAAGRRTGGQTCAAARVPRQAAAARSSSPSACCPAAPRQDQAAWQRRQPHPPHKALEQAGARAGHVAGALQGRTRGRQGLEQASRAA